ncbi:MAG TPA: BLUF domain-containing protein [Devosia sp.]
MAPSNAMQYRRITYISRADADLPATDVRQILGLAEVLHRRHDLSGVLAYTGRHFFQVIEGVDAEVEDLLIQIRADNRHHDMRILCDEVVRQRIHDRWYSLMVDRLDLVDQVEAAHHGEDVGREHAQQLTYRIAALRDQADLPPGSLA